MNRTNKKGFTLVELLVVIAILAILATVSVVGYTAFIERATVSNDENVTAQLNQFLTAMKADSTGDFYNQTVTEENVWQVVDTALKQNGGISELEPQSLEYGYHYFFDIDDQKFIVLKEKDAGITTSGFKAVGGFGLSIVAAGEGKPGFFKYSIKDAEGNTVQHTIFLVDTKGSSLAIAVRGFYTFAGIEPKEGKTVWETFTDALYDSQKQQDNTDYANKTIFVTENGNKTTDDTTEKTNAVVHEGVTSITTDKDDGTKVDFSKIEKIDIPKSVEAIGNDFLNDFGNDLAEGKKPEVTTTKTAEELANTIAKSNDGADKTIEVKITDGNTTIEIKITIKSNKNSVTDENDQTIAEGSFENLANKVELSVVEVPDKIKVVDGVVYIAWDYALNSENKIKFNFKATGEKANLPASYDKVVWGGNGENGNEFDFSNVDRTVETTVTVSLQKTNSEDPSGYTTLASASATVKFVYLTGGNVKINNSDKFELENEDQNGGNTDFVITLDNLSQNITGIENITLDTSFVLSTDSTKLAIDGAKFNLNGVKDLYDATKVSAKVGGYLDLDFYVKVYSKSNLTFVATALAEQIKYIGDDNAITIGDLFALNTGMTLPTNAELHFTPAWADSSNMPGMVPADKQNNSTLVDRTNTVSAITNSSWGSQSLKFQGGAANAGASGQTKVGCYIVIPEGDGYRRISPVVTLQVVDAYNLKNGDTNQTVFSTDTDPDKNEEKNGSGDNHHKVTNQSVVLIGNYTVGKNGYMNLASGKTIYGNYYTLYLNGDVGNGPVAANAARNNSSYVIRLNSGSTMLDLKIIGNEFSTTNDTWYKPLGSDGYHSDIQDYSAATVQSNGGTIKNCYISYGRSALRVTNTTTVEDTVLFGGAYANIDIQNDTRINLKNVVTVNQYEYTVNGTTKTAQLFGGGIVVANATTPAPIYITGDKGLRQFNFMGNNSEEVKHMINEGTPSIQDVVEDLDKSYSIYKDFVKNFKFTNNTTSKTYFNAGILSLKTDEEATGDYLNIHIDGFEKFPNGYNKNSYTLNLLFAKTGVSAATFDNTKTTGDAFNMAFRAQYGFDFSVENFLNEGSNYHPDNWNFAR